MLLGHVYPDWMIMNKAEFQEVLRETNDTLRALTDTKGREYANSLDQLANFKRLSAQLGLTKEQVVMVYLSKHLDSVHSYVRNPDQDLSEPIQGRIHDAILYLVLLKACIIDED